MEAKWNLGEKKTIYSDVTLMKAEMFLLPKLHKPRTYAKELTSQSWR